MFKKITIKMFLYALLFALIPTVSFSQPPTEEEILASIELGIPWLVSQQNGSGYWGTTEAVAYTGFALTKLCDYANEQGLSPFDEGFVYHSNVESGFDYLMANVKTHGPGTGLCATPSLNYHHETYNAAIALTAVVLSKSPTRVISSTNSDVNGLTFKQVQDEMVNYFAWSQLQVSDGGWSYNPIERPSDNSHTGYVTLALTYAESEGSIIPAALKSNLSTWIDFIQNDASGGSGYTEPNQWVNLIKTGNLLTEMAFVGDALLDTRVQAALGFIQSNWNAYNPGIFEYGIGDPQTMYCLMKGLESFGIETISVSGPDDTNWFEVFATDLVSNQNVMGYWGDEASIWDNNFLNTCWSLFVLEKIVPNKPPVAVCQNVTVTADENCDGFALAMDFDGGSYDPDDDPITIEVSPEGPYSLGETVVTLTVTDDSGESDECTATVTVVDETPPEITATAEPFVLKQNNHKYETFGLEDFDIMVSDNCSELDIWNVKIVRVTSDEIEDAIDLGFGDPDGSTLNDIVIAEDCKSVDLRKERRGDGNGRVYTVYLEVKDESGNAASSVVLVYVKHNAFAEVIDDGPIYEVLGNCNMEKSGLIVDLSQVSEGFKLSNYPNPFSSSTTIQFTIPDETRVMLKIYNIFGQEIETLVNQKYLSGTHIVKYEANGLPAGNYFYRMQTNDYCITEKMIIK